MRNQDDMTPLFDTLPDLSPYQRAALKERYQFMMRDYRYRTLTYAILFYVLRITMTVGSLTVPALISIKTYTTTTSDVDSAVYWFTWALSLAVTTANGLMTLFKLDKRYFMIHATAERIRSETWQYISLSGRYSGHYGGLRPTHKNQYIYYFTKLERIRMKHVSDEFVRSPSGGVSSGGGSNIESPAGAAAPAAGAGGGGAGVSPSNEGVPTPPDQSTLPRRPTGIPRRDSESTVGTDDTAVEVNDEAGAPAVPMHNGDRPPLQGTSATGNPVLPAASAVSAGAHER